MPQQVRSGQRPSHRVVYEDLSRTSVALIEFQSGNFETALQLYLKAYEERQDVGLLSNASLAALRSGDHRG